MGKIRGIDVILVEKIKIGQDSFGADIFEDRQILVKDVLVGQPSSDDIVESQNLYGKKLAYVLGIPKNDTNDWVDKEVIFFGQRFRTFAYPLESIPDLIPLRWNKKVRVEKYG